MRLLRSALVTMSAVNNTLHAPCNQPTRAAWLGTAWGLHQLHQLLLKPAPERRTGTASAATHMTGISNNHSNFQSRT